MIGGEVDDGAAHAVVDREGLTVGELLVSVVAAHHDLVADREAATGDLDLTIEGQVTGGGEEVAGVAVEETGLGPGAGE